MIKTLRIAGLTALATLGFMQSAQAANHELFMGFRTAATGDNDMIVSLGLFSSLPTSGVITNIYADLVAQFGANWNTRTDLSFGVAGSNISGTRVTYFSNFGDGFSGSMSSGVHSTLASNVSSIDQIKWDTTNAIQSNKGTSGINSLVSIKEDNNTSGWTVKGGSAGGVFGQNLITRSEWEQTTDFSLISAKEFDIWSYTSGGTFADATLQTYTLDSLGNISAVPEPSTYGLMGAGALAAAAFVRRRRKAAAKVA